MDFDDGSDEVGNKDSCFCFFCSFEVVTSNAVDGAEIRRENPLNLGTF